MLLRQDQAVVPAFFVEDLTYRRVLRGLPIQLDDRWLSKRWLGRCGDPQKSRPSPWDDSTPSTNLRSGVLSNQGQPVTIGVGDDVTQWFNDDGRPLATPKV